MVQCADFIQYFVVCCSVVQFVAMCCSLFSAMQCVSVCLVCSMCCSAMQCVAACCSVLHRAAMCCSVLQCVAVCCSVLQCVIARCSVLQYAAVCSNVLQFIRRDAVRFSAFAAQYVVLQCVSVRLVCSIEMQCDDSHIHAQKYYGTFRTSAIYDQDLPPSECSFFHIIRCVLQGVAGCCRVYCCRG